MPDNIEKLTETLTEFITESSVRSMRFETNQEHLTKAVTEMTSMHSQMLKSNTRLEEKVVSLEANALDKINLIQDSLSTTIGRVSDLERISLKEEGRQEVRTDNRKFWANNWLKFVTLFCIAIPVIATIFTLVKSTGKVG